MAGRLVITDHQNPYFVDSWRRVQEVQAAMQAAGIDAYPDQDLRTDT